MNIDRPKLAIGTFAATLAVAFMGMALLPSTKVDYAYKVAWLGRGYISISVWNLDKNRQEAIKLTGVQDARGKDIRFIGPGRGIWRLKPGNAKKLSLVTNVNGHKRTLIVSIPGSSLTPVVEARGPIAFRCKDMGFMVVPLAGVPVFGLPNPFMVLPRQESGALSPVLPALLRLEFRSSGKSVTLNFKNDKTPVESMPVQPSRPLIFRIMMGDRQVCRYSYYLEGRAKGMVMDRTPVLLDAHRPVFHARLRIFNPPMRAHCMVYSRQDVRLHGPLSYKYLDITGNEADIRMPLPKKPGMYYVICTPDPVVPLYYYVRRNVLVVGKKPGQQVLDALDNFAMPTKNRQTILSLEKTGRTGAAMEVLASEMPDLLPPVSILANTLKGDKQRRTKRHEQAARILLILIGTAFAGITLWLVMVSVGSHKDLQRAMAEEGANAGMPWMEMALFVLVNLVNVIALLYTLHLVFF